MNTLLIQTPPAIEPVTLAEAKAHLRVGDMADDALITTLITAARQVAEQWLGRALISQTLRYLCDAEPATSTLQLPRPPLVSVSSIKTYDDADNANLMPATLYTSEPGGRVALRQGALWPQPNRVMNGFEVVYVAGYGTSASDVPMPIRQGILAHIAHLYTCRGDMQDNIAITRAGFSLPAQAMALYAPYRVMPGVA